jgi:hypothetical protein
MMWRLYIITGFRVFRPRRTPWGELTKFWTDRDWEWFRIYGRGMGRSR